MADKKVNSIDDALNVLDKAAQENRDDVKARLSEDYESIKRSMQNMKPAASEAWAGVKEDMKKRSQRSVESMKDSLYAARDIGSEVSKDAAKKVEQNVRQEPLKYLGGAAAASAVLGFLVGRKVYRRKIEIREKE